MRACGVDEDMIGDRKGWRRKMTLAVWNKGEDTSNEEHYHRV